jgi:5'-phosphate synthase pdxT subunit
MTTVAMEETGTRLTVGILALQGDYTPHRKAIDALGHDAVLVRYPEQLEPLDRLIMPGGESTTIGKLLERWGFVEALRARVNQGLPVWGTCAGAILLARGVEGPCPHGLGLMDIAVRRNAYGRQVDSFVADVAVAGLEAPVRGVFIRAPIITEVGPGVEVLATHDGHIVAARQEARLATTFHPELTSDGRLHAMFVERAGCPQTTEWSVTT